MIDPRRPNYSNTPVSDSRPDFEYGRADVNERPCATIITPYFNTGPLLHETAKCVFGQSLQQWEWLIIDDGTTDANALRVLDRYRGCDPRVRVIEHSENRGLSAARNTGFSEATTELILQLDADDLIEPTTLEKSVWYLESFPAAAFVKGYTVGFGSETYCWTRGFHEGQAFLRENLVTATTMIRRRVHTEVGGYDESIRGGMEDWDFWLRCADRGHWGGTIPEFLDWYRRRPMENRAWANLNAEESGRAFRARMRRQCPSLFNERFPVMEPPEFVPYGGAGSKPPFANRLTKGGRRLLMIVPWLQTGGADKFNLDLVRQVMKRGWQVTIATTLNGSHHWLPQFTDATADVFPMHHFLQLADMPRFLRYLIESRGPDVVMVSNSALGYLLLSYLRSVCPGPAYIDYNHMEEEYWHNGGHPRFGAGFKDLLELNLVTSQHLRQWMIGRGADESRVEVATINVDPDAWRPDAELRCKIREEHGLDDQTQVILYAGRICPQKQPKVFAQTMHALARRKCEFMALVAGDGGDLPWLQDYVDGHGLAGQVRLLGQVSSDEMGGLMKAADIFFLPSLWEGIALSIYEAMASGLTVVGAAVGGQRELVTPGCGFLLARRDEAREVEQYADLLERLLRDPDDRRRIGEQARRRICEQFTLNAMGERMVGLLERAIGLRSECPREAPPAGLAEEFATQAIEFTRAISALDRIGLKSVRDSRTGFDLQNEAGIREFEVVTQRLWREMQTRNEERDWQLEEARRLASVWDTQSDRVRSAENKVAAWERQVLVRVLRRLGLIKDIH
ncbi:MAG: glycosyltransferase [Planctomycetota bacterium]|nr:glycosyltransferase [Planctomycetota bacterium]